jgi:hypothetical protein
MKKLTLKDFVFLICGNCTIVLNKNGPEAPNCAEYKTCKKHIEKGGFKVTEIIEETETALEIARNHVNWIIDFVKDARFELVHKDSIIDYVKDVRDKYEEAIRENNLCNKDSFPGCSSCKSFSSYWGCKNKNCRCGYEKKEEK